MAEQSEQIVQASKEVKKLQTEKESPAQLKQRAVEIATAADAGAAELRRTKVESAQATGFLIDSVPKVIGYLGEVAQRGHEIIQTKDENYPPIDALKTSLKSELNLEKESLGFFAAIEKCDKDYNKIKTTTTADNAEKMYASLQTALGKLPPGIGVSKAYRDEVEKNVSDFMPKVAKLASDKTKIDGVAKKIKELEPLAQKCEKDPTDDNFQAYRQKAAEMDLDTIDKEVFGAALEVHSANQEANPLQGAYSGLESKFKASKGDLEKLNKQVETKENEGYEKRAKKMLEDVDSAEKSQLSGTYEKYARKASFNYIENEEERKDFIATESGLLNGYLALQMAVNPFTPMVFNKLTPETSAKVNKAAEDIAAKIRQIEVNKQTRMSRESLSKTNIFVYVDMLGEEKDGKIYKFNSAYDALPEPKKTNVRMAIESIFTHDEAAVKQETSEAKLKLLRSSNNFDQIDKLMGEKAKQYTEGLRLLMQGQNQEALVSFKAFVALESTFSKEDLAANNSVLNGALKDAKEKIALMGQAQDYFEALNRMKSNDPDGAAVLLKSYIDKVGAMPPEAQKIHAEQLESAKNLLKMYGHQKIQQIDGLLDDVCEWKRADIVDRADTGGNKRQNVVVSGPEVLLIQDELMALRQRVETGEILDFNTEFGKVKQKVKAYLDKNAINKQDNVIDKLSELYEGMNSGDPRKKRETIIAFAKDLRDKKSYDLARKYLDKVLQDEYKEAQKTLEPSKMKQIMLDDPKVMQGIRDQAKMYFDRMKQENPGADLEFLRTRAEQLCFNAAFNKQYGRELRKIMTDRGLAKTNDALDLYNDWSPYKTREHFWQSGSFDAETYDEFKREAAQFTAMTIATLPLGGIAGGAAKGAGSLIFRAASSLLLRGGGKALAREGAILALERGGLLALSPGTRAFQALEPALQQVIIQNQTRLAIAGGTAFLGGVGVEAAVLMGGSHLAEGVVYGQAGEINWSTFGETALKTLVFRGIGFGGNKLFGKGMLRGGARGKAAFVGMEAFSGVMGLGVEAGSMYLQGHGDQIDTKFILENLVQNAIQSAGTHFGHGLVHGPESPRFRSRADKRLIEAELSHRKQNPSIEIKPPQSRRLGPYREAAPAYEAHKEELILKGLPELKYSNETSDVRAKAAEARERANASKQPADELAARNLERKAKYREIREMAMGYEKMLKENKNLSHEQREALSKRVRELRVLEENLRHLDRSAAGYENEERYVSIQDPNNPGKKIRINLLEGIRSKNGAYSEDFLELMNNHEKLMNEGPIIVKHGGDEIVILHAGPNGKIELYFADIGNMGPTNEFAMRLAGGDANIVDVYLHELQKTLKDCFQPGKEVDPNLLTRIKEDVAKRIFGIESEAEYNVLKKKWGIQGSWAEYRNSVRASNVYAAFRGLARSMQKSYMQENGDVTFANRNEADRKFGAYVDAQIRTLDSGEPSMVEFLRDNFTRLRQLNVFVDVLQPFNTRQRKTNEGTFTADKIRDVLNKPQSQQTSEEKLLLLFTLKRIRSEKIPSNMGPTAQQVKSRFDAVYQKDSEYGLMDMQISGAEIPKFQGDRKFTHKEMKFYLDKVLEDALHEAKSQKDRNEIFKVDTPFREDGTFKDNVDDNTKAAYEASGNDEKPRDVAKFREKIQQARDLLDAIVKETERLRAKENVTNEELSHLAELKQQYEDLKVEIDRYKFKDTETDADRPAKFEQGHESWFVDRSGQKIPEEFRIVRTITIDLVKAGAVNSNRGYEVTNRSMRELHKFLEAKFPGMSARVKSGGGQVELVYLDSRTLPTQNGKPLSAREHAQQVSTALSQIAPEINKIINADAATMIDGIVRDASSRFGKKPRLALDVGALAVTNVADVSNLQVRAITMSSSPITLDNVKARSRMFQFSEYVLKKTLSARNANSVPTNNTVPGNEYRTATDAPPTEDLSRETRQEIDTAKKIDDAQRKIEINLQKLNESKNATEQERIVYDYAIAEARYELAVLNKDPEPARLEARIKFLEIRQMRFEIERSSKSLDAYRTAAQLAGARRRMSELNLVQARAENSEPKIHSAENELAIHTHEETSNRLIVAKLEHASPAEIISLEYRLKLAEFTIANINNDAEAVARILPELSMANKRNEFWQKISRDGRGLDMNDSFQRAELSRMMHPQDFAVLEANHQTLPNEFIVSIFNGGTDRSITVAGPNGQYATKTVRVYQGNYINEGYFGSVSHCLIAEKGSTQLEQGVIKLNKHQSAYNKANFQFEQRNGLELADAVKDKPELKDAVIEVVGVGENFTIYKKVTNEAGETMNMHQAVTKMSTRNWLHAYGTYFKNAISLYRQTGIVFADNKPENIMMGRKGPVMIDPGGNISERGIRERRIGSDGAGPVHYYYDERGQVAQAYVPMTIVFHNQLLYTQCITGQAHLDRVISYSTGRTITWFLATKGFYTPEGYLRDNLPGHVKRMADLALGLEYGTDTRPLEEIQQEFMSLAALFK